MNHPPRFQLTSLVAIARQMTPHRAAPRRLQPGAATPASPRAMRLYEAVLLVSILGAATLLTGCGGGNDSGSGSTIEPRQAGWNKPSASSTAPSRARWSAWMPTTMVFASLVKPRAPPLPTAA